MSSHMSINQTDDDIRRILARARTICLVGASPKPDRASYRVGHFLAERGYRVIGVNPGQAGTELYGEPVASSMEEAAARAEIDFLDIFRRSDAVLPVVEEALNVLPKLKTIWMQLGVMNAEAAELARSRGIDVVEDRCPAIDYPRLFGTIRVDEIEG